MTRFLVEPPAVEAQTMAAPEGRFLLEPPEPKKVGALDRVRAGAAGVNKGFFADLVGMPVDAAANVVDLVKAGVGTVAGLAGRSDLMPEVSSDRSGIVGSSQWIERKINESGMGEAINNPNPEDRMSRVLHMGGRVAGSSINPDPRAKVSAGEQALRMAMGELSGLAAGTVGEVKPEYAGVAGMVPQLAATVAAAGARQAIHGGGGGRRVMEQRIQDFKNAGVDEPSVGLASGNKTVQGIENILSQTPGSVNIYEKHKNAILNALQGRTNQLRDRTSPVYGAEETGAAIQSDLKGSFRDRINSTARNLNDRVEQVVGRDTVAAIPETLARSTQLTTPIKGAEATSSQLINGRIAQIAENLRADVYGSQPVVGGNGVRQNPTLNTAVEPHAGTPPANASLWNAPYPATPQTVNNPTLWNAPAVTVPPMQRRDITMTLPASGSGPANAALWNARKENGIPFGALKGLRTSIGEEASSNAIMGTPEQGQFKRLYGAMSQDMREAVNAADRRNAGVPVGPLLQSQQPGSAALNKANDYYSKAMNRADELNPIANRATPEGAYTAVAKSLESGPTIYQRLRGAVQPETRQKIVASVIDDLGKANPGQQSADGDAWSPRTFLTNYNKLDSQARTELFKRIPGGTKMAADLQDVAKAAEMISDSSKVWANPSGTTAAAVSRGTMWTLTAGAFFQPLVSGTVAGGLLLGNQASQRLLLNPKFVNWLAKAPKVSKAGLQSYAQMLISTTNKTNDPQFKRDVAEYLTLVNDGVQEVEQ